MFEKHTTNDEQNSKTENSKPVPVEVKTCCYAMANNTPAPENPVIKNTENENSLPSDTIPCPAENPAEKNIAIQEEQPTDDIQCSGEKADEIESFFEDKNSAPVAEPPPAEDPSPVVILPAEFEHPGEDKNTAEKEAAVPPAFPDMEQLRQMIKEELKQQFESSAEQVEAEFRKLRRVLEDSVDKDKMLEEKDELFQRVYAELKKHQTGFVRDINMPFIKTAIKWYERASGMHRYYNENAPSGKPCQMYSSLLKEFGSFGDYILDLLAEHDIEAILPAAGDKFDPALHAALETKSCTNAELNNTIAECYSPGFHFLTDGKIIQFAQVSVFKFIQEIKE